MDDRENVLEDLYVLWVEAQVLHWVSEDLTSESGGSPTGLIGTTSGEASEEVAPWAMERGRSVNASMARPLVDMAVTGQGASQLGNGDGNQRPNRWRAHWVTWQ